MNGQRYGYPYDLRKTESASQCKVIYPDGKVEYADPDYWEKISRRFRIPGKPVKHARV